MDSIITKPDITLEDWHYDPGLGFRSDPGWRGRVRGDPDQLWNWLSSRMTGDYNLTEGYASDRPISFVYIQEDKDAAFFALTFMA